LGNDAQIHDLAEGSLPDLDDFDTVVVGANAFRFKLNKRATRFVKKNLDLLLKKPLYLFICSGSDNDGARKLFTASYPAASIKHASALENFGGRLVSTDEPWLVRKMLTRMGIKDYDTLTLNHITEWAKLISKTSLVAHYR